MISHYSLLLLGSERGGDCLNVFLLARLSLPGYFGLREQAFGGFLKYLSSVMLPDCCLF